MAVSLAILLESCADMRRRITVLADPSFWVANPGAAAIMVLFTTIFKVCTIIVGRLQASHGVASVAHEITAAVSKRAVVPKLCTRAGSGVHVACKTTATHSGGALTPEACTSTPGLV